MSPLVKSYKVLVIREGGDDPITGEYYEETEEFLEIDATSPQSALSISYALCTIPFRGQVRRTYIDGQECFSDKL